jgi:hypothetical protein
MTDVAQLNQGRFYWVLVHSSTKDPEWQPARFTGVAGHGAGATWDFIGFNSDVGHYWMRQKAGQLRAFDPSTPTREAQRAPQVRQC